LINAIDMAQYQINPRFVDGDVGRGDACAKMQYVASTIAFLPNYITATTQVE